MSELTSKVEGVRNDLKRRFGAFDCSLHALQMVIARLEAMKLRTTDCPLYIYQQEIDDLLSSIHKWFAGQAIDTKKKMEVSE